MVPQPAKPKSGLPPEVRAAAGNSYQPLDVAQLANVPRELQGGQRFVCWSVEIRDGKPTKVPVNPHTGAKAKSNDPATWGTLAEAVALYKKYPKKMIGVGRMFDDADDYVGIDFDECLDEHGEIKPEHPAAKWVSRLNSYTELSPSGNGLKVFVRSRHKLNGESGKSGTRNAFLQTEMYRCRRFFTLTGKRRTEYSALVETREQEVAELWGEIAPKNKAADAEPGASTSTALSDTEIIRRASNANNGAKFKALWEGNWEGSYGSQSEGDAALCHLLWFWTGDRGTVRRLFGQSGLGQRDKWQERHDYREATLILACRGEVYSPRDKMQAAPLGTPPDAASGPTMTPEDAARITGELIEKCRAWIRRFVVVGDHEVTILACWLLHTWAFIVAVTTPYLHVNSPEKSSGKTTLLTVLKALARAPRFSSSISAAVLARVVANNKPTLFIDELDAQMRGDKERAQDIRGVLNSGFEINGTYTRCVGKNFVPTDFPIFCPKVLAGLGELWDTVESRSISIEMRRRLPSEKVEAFRQRRVEKDAIPLREALQAWASSGVLELLEKIEVADVPGLSDRQMDISEPLLQIAQLAGGCWLQRLTGALLSIFGAHSAEDASIGVTLLQDIRAVFDECKADGIPSKDLAAHLCGIEGRPWAEWSHGKGLTANTLAGQLKKYGIHPHSIRVGDKTPKGYQRCDFEDSWERYCAYTPLQNATTPQPVSLLAETAFSDRNTNTPVAVGKCAANPHEQRRVAAVAVQNGEDADADGPKTDLDELSEAETDTDPDEVWL
jgi:hypothetical protein